MKIKYLLSDFVVEEVIHGIEISKIEISTIHSIADFNTYSEQKVYLNFKIFKKGVSTFFVIELLEKIAKNIIKDITENIYSNAIKVNWLGLKDKYSYSKQYIQLEFSLNELLLSDKMFVIKFVQILLNELKKYDNKFEIEFIGISFDKLTLKNLKYNHFSIILRDIDKKELDYYLRNIEVVNKNGFPNYYDEQRFPIKFVDNSIFQNFFSFNFLGLEKFFNSGNFVYLKNSSNIFKNIFIFEKDREKLDNKYLYKIRKEVWDSFIFNLYLSYKVIKIFSPFIKYYLTKNLFIVLPLYEYEIKWDEIYPKNFFLNYVNNSRMEWVNVEYLNKEVDKDEYHNKRYKIFIDFYLPAGSYATIFIKSIVPINTFSSTKKKPLTIK